jgi:hypothetical protein
LIVRSSSSIEQLQRRELRPDVAPSVREHGRACSGTNGTEATEDAVQQLVREAAESLMRSSPARLRWSSSIGGGDYGGAPFYRSAAVVSTDSNQLGFARNRWRRHDDGLVANLYMGRLLRSHVKQSPGLFLDSARSHSQEL